LVGWLVYLDVIQFYIAYSHFWINPAISDLIWRCSQLSDLSIRSTQFYIGLSHFYGDPLWWKKWEDGNDSDDFSPNSPENILNPDPCDPFHYYNSNMMGIIGGLKNWGNPFFKIEILSA